MHALRIALIIIFALVYPVAMDIEMFSPGDPLPLEFLPWLALLLPPLIAFWGLPFHNNENRVSLIMGICVVYIIIFYIIFEYLPMHDLGWLGTIENMNGGEKIRPRPQRF